MKIKYDSPEKLEARAQEIFNEKIAPRFQDCTQNQIDLMFTGFLLGFSKGITEGFTTVAEQLNQKTK